MEFLEVEAHGRQLLGSKALVGVMSEFHDPAQSIGSWVNPRADLGISKMIKISPRRQTPVLRSPSPTR